MSDPANSGTKADQSEAPEATLARRRVFPLVALAWLMLIYTWVLGHFPAANHWMNHLWSDSPGLNLASLFGQNLQLTQLHSLCLFKQLVGLPCVFCGVTRSFIHLSQGQWRISLQYHLLGIPFYLVTLFLAFLGLLTPQKVQVALACLKDKRLLAIILTVLSVCWAWKLGQDPAFW